MRGSVTRPFMLYIAYIVFIPCYTLRSTWCPDSDIFAIIRASAVSGFAKMSSVIGGYGTNAMYCRKAADLLVTRPYCERGLINNLHTRHGSIWGIVVPSTCYDPNSKFSCPIEISLWTIHCRRTINYCSFETGRL